MESVTSSPQAAQAKAFENPLMSNGMLRRMYTYLVNCRAAARRGGKGLEAIEVATLVHLRPGDTVAPIGAVWSSSRFAESPLATMVAEIHTEVHENASPRLLLADNADPAAQVAIATGIAFALQNHPHGSVVIVFADRTALSAAALDAMEFAGVRKLPIIYAVETNLVSATTLAKLRKLDDEINAVAAECGFPAMPVDGQDAVAVYRVAQESIARARKGGGPTLVDCKTWRGRTNTSASIKHAWKPIDPIKHMEAYLKKKDL